MDPRIAPSARCPAASYPAPMTISLLLTLAASLSAAPQEAQGFEAEGPVKTVKELRAALARGRKVVAAGGRYMIDAWIEVEDALERRRTDGGRGEGDKKK